MRNSKSGWVKIHRSILEWEWYGDLPVRTVFIHLILTVNHSPKRVKGKVVERGQTWTSANTLARETGLSVKQVRTALSKLEKTGETASERASDGSIVTVCNYDSYQSFSNDEGQAEGHSIGKRWVSDGQARGNRGATNNNDKNENHSIIEEGSAIAANDLLHNEDQASIKHQSLSYATVGVTDVATLTKPSRPKGTSKQKADPNATYHTHASMNKSIQDFIRHREEIKKPMTPRAVELMMMDFKGFSIKECTEAIKTAIVGGYQGVFPKKESASPSQKSYDVSAGPNLPKDIDYTKGTLKL